MNTTATLYVCRTRLGLYVQVYSTCMLGKIWNPSDGHWPQPHGRSALLIPLRSRWLKDPNADSTELFRMVAEIFILWCKSSVGLTGTSRKQTGFDVFIALIVIVLRLLYPPHCDTEL